MNKNIKKLVLAGVLGIAVCGSTFAAPRGGQKGGHEPKRAKVQYQQPKAQHHNGGHDRGRNVAPKHHRTETHVVHHVVEPARAPHHAPAPAPVPPPKPHHGTTLHTGDWVTLGASAVGGLVGGIIGAIVH